MNDKSLKPPYPSYKAFESTIQELREYQHPPAVIDRSYLSKRSGSEQSSLMLTFRWFGLTNEDNVPTEKMQELISANEERSVTLLRLMMEESYSFLNDGSLDLLRGTTNQIADKFREYNISGSTLVKSISFFLAAARAAGIEVGPHIKAPKAPQNGASRRKAGISKSKSNTPNPPPPAGKDHPPKGTVVIPLPIFGGGEIRLPASLNKKQWDTVISVTELVLKSYRDTIPHGEDHDDVDEEDLS